MAGSVGAYPLSSCPAGLRPEAKPRRDGRFAATGGARRPCLITRMRPAPVGQL